jgi:hypothetical protein
LAKLGQDLAPHLAVLERHDLSTTRGLYAFTLTGELALAVAAISDRTCGAVCTRVDLAEGPPPGVDVLLMSGYVRTDDANTLADRVGVWLSSDLSANLCRSLGNEPGPARRLAALVIDGRSEPEYVAAVRQRTAFCPTASISLPVEVDELWLVIGPVACHYSDATGWRAVDMPDARDWS